MIDLQIEAGRVRALVSGSEIYEVGIKIKPLAKQRWTGIKGKCAGQIGSKEAGNWHSRHDRARRVMAAR